MKRTSDFNDFMSDQVNINDSRLKKLNSGVKGVSEHLGKNLDGFQKVERQGSYALRTIIRPVNDHEYDADILLYMYYVPGKSPKEYIEDVYQCMKQNQTYADKVHRKTRCVVVDYAGDFHLDIVPCITYQGSQFICNKKTGEFEPTDGTGYRDWFNGKNQITSGNLKRVTRLFKYLRDHKQTFTAPSILLTTLIGSAVWDSDGKQEFGTLPDALVTVSNRINDFLQVNPFMPIIVNPALPSEDFVRHWNQAKYSHFMDMFARYTERINDAYAETDGQRSVRGWRDLFGDGFGSLTYQTRSAAAKSTGGPSATVTPKKPWAK